MPRLERLDERGDQLRSEVLPRVLDREHHVLGVDAGGNPDGPVDIGIASTAVYAQAKGWATVIPTEPPAGGIAASSSAVAGLAPALRAARLPPTQALWSV